MTSGVFAEKGNSASPGEPIARGKGKLGTYLGTPSILEPRTPVGVRSLCFPLIGRKNATTGNVEGLRGWWAG